MTVQNINSSILRLFCFKLLKSYILFFHPLKPAWQLVPVMHTLDIYLKNELIKQKTNIILKTRPLMYIYAITNLYTDNIFQ